MPNREDCWLAALNRWLNISGFYFCTIHRCEMFYRFALSIWIVFIYSFMPAAFSQTIALDIGHSLTKPGAISSRGRTEFSFNRDLTVSISQKLQENGFEVLLIGDKGDMDDLRARTRIASKAVFFLSVHHDSVQPVYLEHWQVNGEPQQYSDRFSGFSLFVSRANPYLASSLVCATAMGIALRQAGFQSSPHHAEPIAGENRPFADRLNGVYYFDGLVVLKTATIPAVLLEAGIIVNRDDEPLLSRSETRAKIAMAIAHGLLACLK